MTQLGVGEGTVKRKRRNPRQQVQDVSVIEASGLTLGRDGYPHPLETDLHGKLKVTERTAVDVLEDILSELRWIREGLVLEGRIQDMAS